MGATQDFTQKVIQRYGWSAHFETNDDGYWKVTVVVGLNSRHEFTSDATKDMKKAKELLSIQAMQALATDIQNEEAKQVYALTDVFPSAIAIKDSNDPSTWSEFWNNPPNVVGIDTEGNQISPPVLIQVSTEDFTILEVPKGQISSHIRRLLKDDSIVKVFCDNFSHRDKKCLNCLPTTTTSDFSIAPIVDLESICNQVAGMVTKVPRGLSNIVSMTFPELNVRIKKPSKNRMKNIGRFAMIEQGKAKPLKRLDDLTDKEQQYAALDSWCTLQGYLRIQKLVSTTDSKAPTSNTIDIDKLAADPDALQELVETNLSLTNQLYQAQSLLAQKESDLDLANAKIKGLEEQLNPTWNGPHLPDSDDDTIHPIGSKRNKRRSINNNKCKGDDYKKNDKNNKNKDSKRAGTGKQTARRKSSMKKSRENTNGMEGLEINF